MKWLKRFFWLLVLLLLLLVALIGYVTSTSGGMQRLFSFGQDKLGDELSIGASEGRLVGPASFTDINFKNASGVEVEVSSANYDWQPKQLFSRTLRVDTLNVSGVTVRLPETQASAEASVAEPFQLSDLSIPLGIDFEQLSIKDITVYPPGATTPIIIDEVLLRAGGEDDALKLLELSVISPQGSLALDGTLNTSGDWPLALDSDWQFEHQDYGLFSGEGNIAGNLNDLMIKHQVNGLINATVTAQVKDVTGKVSWDANVVADSSDLGPLSEGLQGLPVSMDIDTTGSLEQFYATGSIASDHEQTGPITTDFNLQGDLEQIVFSDSKVLFAESPAEIGYAGTVDLTTLAADMTIDWDNLGYPLIDEPNLVMSPAGTVKFTGTAEDYTVKLNSKVEQDQTGLLSVLAGISGTPDKITVNMLSVDGAPTTVYAVGDINLKTRLVDLKGNWKDVRWPLTGDEELVRSSAADFSVTGDLDDYQVDAKFALAGKDIPEGDWQLSARGNTESLNGLTLQGNVLDGQVNASGDVIFSPTPKWDLLLTADGINPGKQWPEHEGAISFTTKTTGTVTDAGPDVVADIQDLSGNYRGQALGGGGRVAFADGKLSADGMQAKVGSATVNLNGAIGDDLDLTWNLDADDLTHLVPGLTGDVAANGKLTGSQEEPIVEFTLDAKNIDSGSTQVAKVNGSGLIDLTGKQASKIDLTGAGLQLSGYQWKELKLLGDGRPEQHQLTLSLVDDAAPNVALNLQGGVKNERWNGSLDKLDLFKTPVGDWKLHDPVALQASAESFKAEILCLTNLPAVLCTDGTWDANTGVVARIALESFNSELFKDLMPPDVMIDAPLSGTIDFSMKNGANPDAIAHFDIPTGKIQFESQGDVITAVLGESEIDVDLKDDRLTSSADFALGEIGTIKADTTITDLYGKQNLSGQVVSEVQDISLAGIGASQVQSLDGAFGSNLTLAGTVAAPQITGDVSLTDFGAAVPSLSLLFKDGNFKAVSDGKGNLNIDGQVSSGDGGLAVTGFYNPESGKMEIDLKGDDFQVANAKRQKAVISPDLQVKIDGENISVLGDLLIPSAFIQAGGDSGVVVESPDVTVLQDPNEEREEPTSESRVRLGVKVALGDDVRVKAGQFDGALAGGIEIEQLPGQVPTGTGAIEVVSGDFLVYGQKLTMERGRILFGGGPLDNPAIDFDVARDVSTYNVKAGAKILGTAQAPLLELKSDPQQTDANTISYILFGKPVGTGVSYTLGKFITPDLYVSYGIDLFDKIETFNMRYRISERLALIGSSSVQSSADLLYTIER